VADRQQRTAPLQRRHVLVVDDDDDIRRMIRTVLEAAGARVDLAASGADAERMLGECAYDAVLLDWNLDDIGAAKLVERAEQRRPDLRARTVVMTGDLIRRLDCHEAERLGLPLLRKPFRPQELISAVTRAARA
jgi:DNA-binding response OmpR family regulator